MKKLLGIFTIVSMLFMVATALPAEEQLDCDELVELSESLDEISDAVDNAEPEELDEIDAELGKIIQALRVIANSEKNGRLTGALNRLQGAYKAKNQDAFVKAIDQVTDAIDAIESKDCD